MVSLWKVELAVEGLLLEAHFLIVVVLALNQVLKELLELCLHSSDVWRDDVSQNFIQHWNLV